MRKNRVISLEPCGGIRQAAVGRDQIHAAVRMYDGAVKVKLQILRVVDGRQQQVGYIPVQAHFLASEGIPDVLELVKSVRMKFNPDLKIAGILLTMYQWLCL